MLELLLTIAIGMFIGWNLPQPAYARAFQTWIVSRIRNLVTKSE